MTLKEVIDSELREETNLNGTKEPKITVHSTEGTLPHLHYKYDNVENEKKLDKDDLEILVYFLSKTLDEEEFPNEEQYDFARKIWNLNHPSKKVPKII